MHEMQELNSKNNYEDDSKQGSVYKQGDNNDRISNHFGDDLSSRTPRSNNSIDKDDFQDNG